MNRKLNDGDRITIYTKSGRTHTGKYCHLPNGYIGLSDQRLAFPRDTVAKVILHSERK